MQAFDKEEEDNQIDVNKDDSNEDRIDELGVNIIRNTYCSSCGGSGTTRSDVQYFAIVWYNFGYSIFIG